MKHKLTRIQPGLYEVVAGDYLDYLIEVKRINYGSFWGEIWRVYRTRDGSTKRLWEGNTFKEAKQAALAEAERIEKEDISGVS